MLVLKLTEKGVKNFMTHMPVINAKVVQTIAKIIRYTQSLKDTPLVKLEVSLATIRKINAVIKPPNISYFAIVCEGIRFTNEPFIVLKRDENNAEKRPNTIPQA